MLTRFAGALVRGAFVVLLVVLPAQLLPQVADDSVQLVMLVALVAAFLTFSEYFACCPGLIDFRSAPPINRLRFFALFLTLLLLSAVMRDATHPTAATEMVTGFGRSLGSMLDVPASPVGLVMGLLPPGSSLAETDMLRAAAAISYVVSLLTVAAFLILLRVHRWPRQTVALNLWINLPTFASSSRKDLLLRLEYAGRVNLALGILLPFLLPMVIRLWGLAFTPLTLGSPLTLIWMLALWSFGPASLCLRGIAMTRFAQLLARRQQRAELRSAEAEPVTV